MENEETNNEEEYVEQAQVEDTDSGLDIGLDLGDLTPSQGNGFDIDFGQANTSSKKDDGFDFGLDLGLDF